MPAETAFLENLHHVPGVDWTSSAFTVLRAGKVVAAPGHGIRREYHVGQDVLFCVSGTGAAETAGHRLEVQPGQLVWIPNELPHAHLADRNDPWTLLWFRFDGPAPVAIRTKLFGEAVPRATVSDAAGVTSWFDRLFAVLRRRDPSLDFRLNQLVSQFFLLVDQALAGPAQEDALGPLASLMATVRADIRRPWNAQDFARLARLSPSQTRRLFQKILRESPRRWLIRERLTVAQALMLDHNAPLARVAEDCGFCDVYHFGREFKRVVGSSPAAWRRTELGHSSTGATGR